jgi:hypothetical protein
MKCASIWSTRGKVGSKNMDFLKFYDYRRYNLIRCYNWCKK